MSLGQLPVTCGLFFSLGHSTIVIIVVRKITKDKIYMNVTDNTGQNVAIAIRFVNVKIVNLWSYASNCSTDVYDKIGGTQ